jgi:transketolase
MGMTMREAYGKALVALGERDDRIVVLDADVSKSTRSNIFKERFPERFINVGIAEGNMMNIAGGLAACGATHQDITDLAVTRAMPNLTVLSLSDNAQVAKAIPAIADWPGPVYFRLHRNEVPPVSAGDVPFEIGRAVRHREGRDVTFVATGIMVGLSMKAAETLAAEGISAGVVEIHTIKPLDVQTIADVARQTGALVTAEEHNILGGLGGAVAEALGGHQPCILERVGIKDTYAESGPYDALLEKYGLTAGALVEAARRANARKK